MGASERKGETDGVGDGDGDDGLLAVPPESPQAARASTATKTSSANALATIADDPRFP
jgi:hypothetical protein